MAFPRKADKPKRPTGLGDILDSMAADANSCLKDLMSIPKDPPKIDSGSLAVNLLSGIGGFPVGGLVEIAGAYSCGKTTLALRCAAEVQKNGGMVMFADFENAFDPYYAQSLGVDITPPKDGGKFILIQPMNLEDGWNAIQALVGTGEVSLLIIDSVAAAVPKSVVEGEAGLPRIGLQAALLANEYNKLATRCSKSGCTALLLNQVRIKIEQKGLSMVVSEETTGGHALKHYCLMRLWMKIIGRIEDASSDSGEKNFIGNRVRFTFIKNKCSRPYTAGIFIIRFGHGIDNEMALMEMAIEMDVLEQRSSFFVFIMPDGTEVKINGKEGTRKRIAEDPAFRNAISAAMKDVLSKVAGDIPD